MNNYNGNMRDMWGNRIWTDDETRRWERGKEIYEKRLAKAIVALGKLGKGDAVNVVSGLLDISQAEARIWIKRKMGTV